MEQDEALEGDGCRTLLTPTGHRFADRTRAQHATVHALLVAAPTTLTVTSSQKLGQSRHASINTVAGSERRQSAAFQAVVGERGESTGG
ncbi:MULTISPECIES: hypothetical protein [unclassified Streptomyces]|uniref:hypothetical protein n=1 Tax=unclassified Streptomyces TaxID=2593676 RepID=UPI00131DC5AB|nr:hypothetical protein [Streptomyces sp. CB01635]